MSHRHGKPSLRSGAYAEVCASKIGTGSMETHRHALVPPPELTIKAIRAAIPPHCFQRSLLRSLAHLALDLVLIAALAVSVWAIDRLPAFDFVPGFLKLLVVWPMYWWWQGAVMTGVWVLAHECGHQSFSESKTVNDAIGLVLHSALLVPYHSWRITHGLHHKNTNHMDRDQVFVPLTKDEYVRATGVEIKADGSYKFPSRFVEAMEEAPIGDLLNIFKMFTVGWPAYLAMNSSGQQYGPGANHFNPSAKMFTARDYWDIVKSDIGIAAALSTIGTFIFHFGFLNVAKYYLVPYLFVNMWLVLITYMQHSDPTVPHYADDEWNFVRGALCSVDRDYGIYNILHHHIGDTHVAHHLFSQMPFYHAQEATEALKKVLGPYYSSDNTPIFKALLRSWATCKFVDLADGNVMFYRSLRRDCAKEM